MKKLICVLLLCVLICSSVCLFAGCEKEKVDWWDDYENLVIVWEDHRSEPSKVEHQEGSGEDTPDFIYKGSHLKDCKTCKEEGCGEFIPNIKLLYKGESVGHFYVMKRECYSNTSNAYVQINHIPLTMNQHNEKYKVTFGFYYDDLAAREEDSERSYYGGIMDIFLMGEE